MGDEIRFPTAIRTVLLGLALMGSAYANEAPPPPETPPEPIETPAPKAREEEGRGDLSVALRKERDARKAAADKAAELQAKLDAIDAERATAREAELAKQGEYKTLLEEQKASVEALKAEREALAAERDALKAASDAREAKLAERNKTDIDALPDKAKALVEKFGKDQPADRVRELIDEVKATFGDGAAPAKRHSTAGRAAGGEPAANPEALTADERAWLTEHRPSMLISGANDAALKRYVQKATKAAT